MEALRGNYLKPGESRSNGKAEPGHRYRLPALEWSRWPGRRHAKRPPGALGPRGPSAHGSATPLAAGAYGTSRLGFVERPGVGTQPISSTITDAIVMAFRHDRPAPVSSCDGSLATAMETLAILPRNVDAGMPQPG